jgi:hypothetical protein
VIDKMVKKPKALDKRDLETTFSPVKNYKYASEVGAISVSFRETSEASKHYPIMFIKDGDGFSAIALLGVNKEKNLFVNKKGEWTTRYVPAMIGLYPFAFSKTSADSQTISIAYDQSFEGLNKQGGEKFFQDDTSLTAFGEKIKKSAEEIYSDITVAKNILKELDKLNLVTPIDITIGKKEEAQHRITGVFQIDVAKLNKLSDEDILKLTKMGGMNLINNHLNSLSNFENLVNKLS